MSRFFMLVAENLIPLKTLGEGHRASVVEVIGRPDHVQRLRELGFRGGVELEMVRPGSPCIVRLAGHTLCIRGNEMLNVLVRPGGSSGAAS
jgi:ferrous iron transport protein A